MLKIVVFQEGCPVRAGELRALIGVNQDHAAGQGCCRPLANVSEYGLATYFYEKDVAHVTCVAERLEAGMIGINTGLIST